MLVNTAGLHEALRLIASVRDAAYQKFPVHIRAEGEEIHITTATPEVSLTVTVAATNGGSMDCHVPKKQLTQMLGLIEAEEVNLEKRDTQLVVSTKKLQFQLPIVEPEIQADVSKPSGWTTVPSGPFLEGLRTVQHAVGSADNPLYLLNAVHVVPKGSEGFVFFATDGAQMAVRRVETADVTLTKEFSITQTVLSTLTQILKGSDDFDLGITLHTIWIRTENCTLWFSRPAGTPPDYQRALPKKATTRLVVSADELMVAARLVSHADGNMVLIVSDGTAKVESTHSDIRVNLQLQNCEPIAEMRTIVNPRYLVQALQNVGADKVIVKQNDSLEPLVLLPRVDDRPDRIFVIAVMTCD